VSRLREEFLDPWGGVLAGVAGGLAWAVVPAAGAVALPVGLGVAAAVYGVKVGMGLLTRGPDEHPDTAPVLRPPRRGSIAEQWLRRAEAEQREIAELTGGPGPAATRGQLAPVSDGAADAVTTLRRLAGQVGAIEDALDRIPVPRLDGDRARLAEGVRVAHNDRLQAERQRALDSVTEQLAVAGRLTDARDMMIARMQATVLSLEGLVARTAEIVAMSAAGGVDLSEDRLATVADDLDGLRKGLAEAEEVSRRVLDG
jgi:hypothetical protein